MSFATAQERYFVQLVNSTRLENGLAPLKIAKPLNDSAERHSQWMLSADVFSHTGAGGSSASDRMERAGFPMYEPRRVCRGLQLLSRMEHHEQDHEQVFP